MTVEVEIDRKVFLPCYRHLIGSKFDIDFLYGGRDSGKSYFIAQELIRDCLESDYFRCILIKKTYESIKDAQYQTLKDVISDWGLDDVFSCKESPLEIKCINGNKFIARGCDKPEKLKSISNPSHAWYEEGNQLTEEDYITVSTTLRSNKGNVKEWFSFNPEYEGELKDNWIYKTYFQGKPTAKNFTSSLEVTVGKKHYKMRYQATHTTYLNNPHVTDQRLAKLETLAQSNPHYHKVYAKGLWGTKRAVGSEFYSSFNSGLHVKDITYDSNLPVHLSFDFNVVPYMTMLCCQIVVNEQGTTFKFFKEYCLPNPNNSSRAAAEHFVRDFGKYKPVVFYYGDASGKNRIAGQGNKRNFDDIDSVLINFLHSRSDMVLSKNPNQLKARDFINLIFAGYWKDIKIEVDTNCSELIKDFENVRLGIEGKVKEKVNDKKLGITYEKYGHTSDAFTYLIISALYQLYNTTSAIG